MPGQSGPSGTISASFSSVSDQLREDVSAFNARWTSERLVQEALRRLALHNSVSRKIVKEEQKASKSRAEASEILNESGNQILRALIQTIQRLTKENEELSSREAKQKRYERHLEETMEAMVRHLDQHPLDKPFIWDSRILEPAFPQILSEEQTPDLSLSSPSSSVATSDEIVSVTTHNDEFFHEPSTLDAVLFQLQSSIQKALVVRSAAYNPESQLQTLARINQGRHEQLSRCNAELAVLDDRVRELRNQVAVGVRKRCYVLEEATSTAYTRSFQQHHSELRRLQIDRDALSVELNRVKKQLSHLQHAQGPLANSGPRRGYSSGKTFLPLAPAC